jgi:membrane protein CcdC involved in cytochrome C biogenesis
MKHDSRFGSLNAALIALIAAAFIFFDQLSHSALVGIFFVGFALAAVIVWKAVKYVVTHRGERGQAGIEPNQ